LFSPLFWFAIENDNSIFRMIKYLSGLMKN